jgi:hypothetical protein
MYPELFERNVNGSRSNITCAGHGLFSRACSNFRQFAVLSGCRRAGLHEAVKSEFVTVLWRNPDVCEDYRRGFRGDRRRLMSRYRSAACTSSAIAANAGVVQNGNHVGTRDRRFGSRRW